MDNNFFTKDVTCPVCNNKFKVTKVKTSSLRVIKKDEDFCPYYEDINPLLYGVWICNECGYAALEEKFEDISDKDIKIMKEKIKNRWSKREFDKKIDLDTAIMLYKLALLGLQTRNAKNSEIAKISIRIAWLFRYKNDERELDFLKIALHAYQSAFENEKFPIESLDELTCTYIIGELNRRLGINDEAAKWFYRVLTVKDLDEKNKARNNMIISMARESIQSLKESKATS